MSRRKLAATILLVALALVSWALGYFLNMPLLDALGSVFAIAAMILRWKSDPAH
jgi:hypothetical protein